LSGFSLYGSALRLSAQDVFDVPLETAYEMASDVGAFETRAVRSGFDLERLPGRKKRWRIEAHARGRMRQIELGLVEARRDESMTFEGTTGQFDFQLRSIFIAQGPGACKVRWDVTASPRTITGRLLLPALKLGRRRLQARLGHALSLLKEFAEESYAPLASLEGAAG